MNQPARFLPFVLLATLAGLCVIWLAPSGTAAPAQPVTPARYEYATFQWPEGTQTATFYRVRESNPVTVDHLVKLGEILEWTQQQLGYDYCGTVGDTIILRRVWTAGQPRAGEYSPVFRVTPDLPAR